jgi:hypothetical protein
VSAEPQRLPLRSWRCRVWKIRQTCTDAIAYFNMAAARLLFRLHIRRVSIAPYKWLSPRSLSSGNAHQKVTVATHPSSGPCYCPSPLPSPSTATVLGLQALVVSNCLQPCRGIGPMMTSTAFTALSTGLLTIIIYPMKTSKMRRLLRLVLLWILGHSTTPGYASSRLDCPAS